MLAQGQYGNYVVQVESWTVGFHSSFRTAQGGLYLNIDVSTTVIVKPSPLIDFLIAYQNARDPFTLQWEKKKRALKNLRIKTAPSNQEFKIIGSKLITLQQTTVHIDKSPIGLPEGWVMKIRLRMRSRRTDKEVLPMT